MRELAHTSLAAVLGGALLASGAAAAAPASWWDPAWGLRNELTISTGPDRPDKGYDGYTVRVSGFDTQTPIAAGDMQPDCDDLRVVRFDGGSWAEVDRHVIGCNSASTEIRFMLQADIAASSVDTSYFVYHDNPSAGAPAALDTANVYLWYDDASADRSGAYDRGRTDAWHGSGWDDSLVWNPAGYYTFSNGDNFTSGYRRPVDERDVLVEAEFFHTDCFPTNMTTGVIVRGIIGSGSGGSESSDHYYASNRGHQGACGGGYGHDGDIMERNRGTTAVDGADPGPIATGQWRKQALAAWLVNPTHLSFWDADAGWVSPGWPDAGDLHVTGTDADDLEGRGFAGFVAAQDQARVRNLLVRRYVEPEPVITPGHFQISHDGSANDCQAEPVTITKHDGVHAIDPNYTGTISLSTSTGNGSWSVLTGNGSLVDSGGGDASYTFDPSDNGQVVLGLANANAETLNIDVTDGAASEAPGEDPDLTFTPAAGSTDTFRDEFSAQSYGNNDGTLSWSGPWIENDPGPGAPGPGAGNVRVGFGVLFMDDRPDTGGQPSAEREADLSGFDSATFSFDFGTTPGVDPTDAAVVEISADGGGSWTVLETFTGINGASAGGRSFDVTGFMSASTRVRVRITNLYGGGNELFFVDNVQIEATVDAGCPGADHFVLGHDGAGIHCLGEPVEVTPEEIDGTPVAGYDETIVLDTQTGTGSWTATDGDGVLDDPTPNDGQATYAFSGNESFPVTFTLEYPEGPASVDVDVTQSGDPGVRDDDSEGALMFAPSGFTLTPAALGNPPGPIDPIPPQTAGSAFTVHLTAYGQLPGDPVCGVIETYDGAKDLAFWSTYDNPGAGTVAVTVDGSPVSSGEGGAATQPVNFVQGAAQVSAKYKDVGRIRLDVKDESAADPSLPGGIRGGTNPFVSRPAEFELSAIERSADGFANPGAAGAGGGAFIGAGESFSVTVTARDAEGDATPNYGLEAPAEGVALSAALVAPGGGASPPLAWSTGFGGFAGGGATGTDFSWGEVGIIRLTPAVADGDYLGTGDVTGATSGNVGRFVPHDFDVALNAPEFATACTGFGYAGQAFDYATPPVITVTARNAAGGTTTNYAGAFWKITDAELAADGNRTYAAATGSLDTSLLPAPDPAIASNGDGTGTLTFSAGGGLAFDRAAPVAPFDAEVSLSLDVVDEDDVAYAGNPARFGDASPGNGIAFDDGKEIRYGRLAFANAHGSELLALGLPLRSEYFDGAGFATNALDGCSAVSIPFLALSNDAEAGQTDGDIVLGAGSTSASLANSPFVGGEAGLAFSAPGDGNTGYVDVLADLTAATGADLPWLRFDWDGDGSDEDPAGRASFGIYAGSDVVIHVREPWN